MGAHIFSYLIGRQTVSGTSALLIKHGSVPEPLYSHVNDLQRSMILSMIGEVTRRVQILQ
jgi:hypothetical protein